MDASYYIKKPKDCELVGGKYYLDFTLPSTDERRRMFALDPIKLADTVNDIINADIVKMHNKTVIDSYTTSASRLAICAIDQDCCEATACGGILLWAEGQLMIDIDTFDNLSSVNLNHAMNVIRGKVVAKQKPSEVISNGDAILDNIDEKCFGVEML